MVIAFGISVMLTSKVSMLRVGLLLGLLAGTAPALAQSNADKAAAEALFQAGKDLMSQGKYSEACGKFEASQSLDAGLGTLLYLADCYEKANRLASAWANFREAESIARGRADSERAEVARQRAAALEPRLPRIWIKVADGNDPATRVSRNGEAVPRESWGIAIPVDAGDQVFEATAPGRKTWTQTIHVEAEGVNVPVDVPALAVDDTPKPAPAAPPAPAAATAPVREDRGAEGSSGSTQRTIGIVVGGVGVVGLALGTVFGLSAKSKKDQSLDHCEKTNPNLCDQKGVDLRNEAKSAANLATVTLIVGGAALAGGVVLFLTAPSNEQRTAASPTLHVAAGADGLGGARLSLGGTF
jgi:serine/threonine-protein kinase